MPDALPTPLAKAIERAVIGYAPFDDYMDFGNAGDDLKIMAFQEKLIAILTEHVGPAIAQVVLEAERLAYTRAGRYAEHFKSVDLNGTQAAQRIEQWCKDRGINGDHDDG